MSREELRAALAEVRREQRKAALVYASLDAAVVALAVGLLGGVVDHRVLDVPVAPDTFGAVGAPAPDVGAVAAVLAGLVAFGGEFAVRTRRPAAEEFEAANPAVAEALRTARDAAAAGRTNPMARALYDDVLDRLADASGVRLLDATRLAATVAVALALSLASVQTAVVGLDVGSPTGGGGPNGGDAAAGGSAAFENRSSVDLRDGEEVLGDPTDVSAGDENITAAVSSGPGGDGDEERNYDRTGGTGSSRVDAERSGFASPERVEDADLVRRYARRLENDTDV